MASSIRAVAMGLPRVSLIRIPLVAFANSHTTPVSHANSAHPSAYSSMPSRSNKKEKDTAAWATNAKKVADKLEHSAQKMAGPVDKTTKDYLHEVKQFDNAEDELLKDVGFATAMKHTTNSSVGHGGHNKSGGKGDYSQHRQAGPASTTTATSMDFEQTFADQVQADVIHPDAKRKHDTQHHHQEMVSSLIDELKTDKQTSNLSQHASDAIRMVESHSVLKQDSAPIHAVRDEDPSLKDTRDASKHK